MLKLHRVHEYSVDPATSRVRITRENHYIRLREGDNPPVFLTHGQAVYESGDVVRELPEWVRTAIAAIQPAQLQAVGFSYENLAETVKPRESDKPGDQYWVCPECDKQVGLRQKGFHIARHRRGK